MICRDDARLDAGEPAEHEARLDGRVLRAVGEVGGHRVVVLLALLFALPLGEQLRRGGDSQVTLSESRLLPGARPR